jgi:hypothetical protein
LEYAESIEVAALNKLGEQMRAARAAGTLAKQGHGPGRGKKSSSVTEPLSRPTLKALHIDRKTAAKAAHVPVLIVAAKAKHVARFARMGCRGSRRAR